MSNLKKSTLAAAVIASLALAPSAFAYTLTTDGDQIPEQISTFDVPAATDVIVMNENIDITIENTDNIIGRTTGLGIRFTLNNGAVFAATPLIIPGAGIATGSGWETVVAAGGQPGDDFIVISVQPQGGNVPGIPAGLLLSIVGDDAGNPGTQDRGVNLTNLVALQNNGGTVTGTSLIFDPVSTLPILNPSQRTTPLLRSGDPVAFGCDTTGADISKRIDVGVTEDHPSKTFFSSTGEIGLADEGFFHAGAITIERDPAFTFLFAPDDEIVTTVTGSFAAFAASGNSVFLSPDSDCATADVTGTISANGQTITFEYELAELSNADADGASTYLCFEVADDNETTIDASTVTTRSTFTRGDVNGGTNTPAAGCPLLPLQFNGSVVKVFTFNPAGNTLAQSFLRVSNWGSTGGLVTIEGYDDGGNPADSTIRFVLPAGESLQLNSEDLENGNVGKGLAGAFGDGTGRWRMVVTGEFDNMRVVSLNRNSDTGTVTNLTDADNNGEQALNDNF
jgi:hypothetical protein